jgi:integrase
LARVSKITVWGYESKINAAFNQLMRERVIARNPMKEITRVRQQETERDFLTFEELQTLARTPIFTRDTHGCPPIEEWSELRDAFIFSCYTGLRLSDIQKLDHSNIKNRSVQIRQQKTGTTIYNQLHEVAWKIIEPRLSRAGPLFQLPTGATPWRWMKHWQKNSGIQKRISFHTSRHTFAMLALKSSKDLYAVNKLMGHSKLATTAIYLKALDETKKNAIESMPGIELS